jgi:hypothetical protein
LVQIHKSILEKSAVPKDEEIIVDRPHELSNSTRDVAFYKRELTKAFGEGRRVVQPSGVGVVVFASKTAASWEAILDGIIESGWMITASWPIDTEREARIAAQGQARLGSSIHIVCRPRENEDGTLRTDDIGDWRDVQAQLPKRIHEWMPRLAREGIVGADAIFACLGPALEIFSRYSHVEKASGDKVPLREYLEHVWAAVSNEALTMIFKDADAAGLEPEARLTVMWLWTLNAGNSQEAAPDDAEDDEADDEDESPSKKPKAGGFVLEFDAARKIAQGLGINLEKSQSVVEVKGETARLLPVVERARFLFGKAAQAASTPEKKRKAKQLTLIADEKTEKAEKTDNRFGELPDSPPGATVLDRLHQAMILFASGRNEAMKRLLVDEGAGKDARLWKLAQSLSALYPQGSDERRWVEGVMARKKGLGL